MPQLMRSSEMSRQVGAAITDRNGNLIAVGTNEVPKAYVGCYSDGDLPDGRVWRRVSFSCNGSLDRCTLHRHSGLESTCRAHFAG
jgi:deoxycytidylate deaminase